MSSGSQGVDLLNRSWVQSGDRLRDRLAGLTDAEYLWLPADDGWTIHPDPRRPGRWTYDYDFAPPAPAPVTSIAWRLVHLIADNEIYWEYAFGPGRRTFPDLIVPNSVADAREEDLAEPRPSHLGDPKTAGEVVRILLDEQTHHERKSPFCEISTCAARDRCLL